jgi:hypothetical protein
MKRPGRLNMRTLLAVTLTTLMAYSPAWAALRYETELEIVREDKTKFLREKVTTAGERARIDFINADGSSDGSYLVTNDGGKTMAIHDGSQAICATWSTAEFFKTAGEVVKKGRRMFNADISSVERVLVAEETGPDLLGFPTRHLSLRTNYGAEASVLFITFIFSVEELDEVWMTDGIDMPVFERQWLEAGTHTGSEFITEHASEWNQLVDQPVLQHTNTITVTNAKSGKTFSKVENFRLTLLEELAEADLDPDLFSLPDCQEVSPKVMKKEAERMLKKYIL